MAEHINGYFAEIGDKLANNIINSKGINPFEGLSMGPSNVNSDNISNITITTADLQSVLKTVNVDKSSSIPNIRTKVLVHAFKNQEQRIVKMYNGSLTLCTFPDRWKKATVVPLPKIANPKTASDMRPISLLPFPGKLLEMIVSQRLKGYLDNNDILSTKQHGFRKKKSTLFTIYINDLAELIEGNINFYADNTIIYDPDFLQVEADLDRTYRWCNMNLLTVNCKKSQWMRINLSSRDQDETVLTLGDNVLEKVNEYKYLGVIIDSQLTFQTYRDSLINRVNLKISYFKKIRSYMTLESALLLYKGTILPILEYADFVHDFNIKYINKKIQTIQNNALYVVFNQHFLTFDLKDSTETLHRRASLYRLLYRRWMHMVLFVYNYINNQMLMDVRDINTRRRDGILFIVTKMDHFKAKQDPMTRAMNAWNSLNVQIRNSNTKEHLKMCLKNSITNPYKKVE